MITDINKKRFNPDELSGYKVSENYYDGRGWEVKDADNRTIGKEGNLMANKKAERVVYLDVEVDEVIIEAGHETYSAAASEAVHQFLNKDGDNHIIIPVGMITLDEKNEIVLTNEINHSNFAKNNRFSKRAVINREYEIILLRTYVPSNIVDKPSSLGGNVYDGKEFENTLSR